MSQRVKGLECSLAMSTPDGADEDFADFVEEAELTVDLEILQRDYLGHTSQEFDDIFKGISGSAKVHLDSPAYFKFAEKVQDRAERRTPASGVFSLSFTVNFPSGTTARLTAEDLFFGALPLRMPKRDEYLEGEITFQCKRLRRIL